ncbi:MAG: hypothetical protein GC154_16110 [bacterium]|nr:hypothetical protein [bacterium]
MKERFGLRFHGLYTRFFTALAIAVMMIAAPAHADVTVSAAVSPAMIHVNEGAKLSVTVNSNANDQLNPPTVPQIQGLNISYRSQQSSTSWSMVNGQTTTSRSLIYEYDVLGLAEGDYELKDIRVPTANGFVAANPVSLKVLAADAPAPTAEPQSQSQTPDTSQQSNPYGVYFVGQLDKEEAYVGEQVILTYYLLIPREREGDVSIDNVDEQQGQFQGFWVEKHDLGRNFEPEYRSVNNRIYKKYTILRYILFPLKAGEQTIPALKLQGRVSRAMGFSVFRQSDAAVFTSTPITLKVNPLPEEGKPAVFQGAVGGFELSDSVDSKEVKVGDPVTLKVTLSGSGNIRNAPSPVLPDLSMFDQFDPTSSQEVNVTREGVSGKVEYTHVLIPHDVNANEIGPVQFAYFDPQKKEYVTLKTQPIELTVSDAANVHGPYSSGASRRIITRVGDDFRYIHDTPLALSVIPLRMYRGAGFWLLALSPLLIVGGAFAWRRRQDYLSANPDVARSLKAPAVARKFITDAREAFAANDAHRVYAALGKAIEQTVDHRWNLAAAGLTTAQLKERLLERQVDAECVDETTRMMRTVDGARFSGAAGFDRHSIQNDIERTESILQTLMKQK